MKNKDKWKTILVYSALILSIVGVCVLFSIANTIAKAILTVVIIIICGLIQFM